MANDLEELEAINNAAIESIERLENRGGGSRAPSFWDSDPAKKYRPSSQNVSVPLFESSRKYNDPVPRRYYRPSLSSYETSSSGYNQMSDSFYRKMLVSIYKNTPKNKENIERPVMIQMPTLEMPQTMSLSLGIFNSPIIANEPIEQQRAQQTTTSAITQVIDTKYEQLVQPKLPAVSDRTKYQLTAIIMSGALRILTTMVLNWARDREVPYELL